MADLSEVSQITWDSPCSSREGEQWLKMRRVLRQRILKPKDVAVFSGEVNHVIADLIQRIYALRSQADDGETVANVNELFFRYSMEGEVESQVCGGADRALSGILLPEWPVLAALQARLQRMAVVIALRVPARCSLLLLATVSEAGVLTSLSCPGVATILFESRLGCLESQVPQTTVEYIQALELMFSMFKTSMYAGAIPRWLRPLVPKPWQEFCRSWDGLFKFSKRWPKARPAPRPVCTASNSHASPPALPGTPLPGALIVF